MTLFLQYNVNNHVPDGVCNLWWQSVLPDSESVSLLSKGLLNLEPPLCSSGYTPGNALKFNQNISLLWVFTKPGLLTGPWTHSYSGSDQFISL